jgi:hypothetical protein
MKALHLLILLPLSILCSKSTAQVDDLMRDKNITWIAETYNDFMSDKVVENVIGKRLNDVTTLKFINNTEGVSSEKFALQQFILNAVKDKKLTIFKRADCKESMNYDDICKFDSLVGSNNKIIVRRNEIPVKNIPFFRAHQILFYDSSKVQFGLRTLAIAIIGYIYDENNQVISKPVFWIKVADLTEQKHLSNSSITWAKRINFYNGIDLRKDSIRILKQSDEYTPKYPLFRAFHKNDKVSFYKHNGTEITTRYSLAERKHFFEGRDTLETIDPTTYKTTTKIVYRCYPTLGYDYLGLIQNWYWDDKKKRLEIWLSATSILKDVNDSEGNRLYKKPLFYRRTDD